MDEKDRTEQDRTKEGTDCMTRRNIEQRPARTVHSAEQDKR
jgi:hypothetical protein